MSIIESNMRAHKQTLRGSERGMVSIMVTMFIMVVITLLIMAFARIAWREQRQALDRQLSTQAFYAAESGVNAAMTAIANGYNGTKSNCNDTAAPFATAYGVDNASGIVDSSTIVEVTCLLIDAAPDSLEYSNIGMNKSTVARVDEVQNADGTPAVVNSLVFSWQDTTGDTIISGCPNNNIATNSLVPFASWDTNCHAGVLRIDVVDVDGNFDRNDLNSNVMTLFAYPTKNGQDNYSFNTSVTGNNGSGSIVEGRCDPTYTPKTCYVRIHNMDTRNFYIRMRSIYLDNQVTVKGYDNDGAAGEPLRLKGAQRLIDSTGRANDILRRVVVRLPIGSDEYTAPDFALVSAETICKKFSFLPGTIPQVEGGENNCRLL